MSIYICSVGYAELPVVLFNLLQCLVDHMLSKTIRSSGSLHRVTGEVLVLGLLVVAIKMPYSSCVFNTWYSICIRARIDGVCPSYYFLVQRV